MVQIIQEGPKRQSFAQKLNLGVGRGLEGAQQIFDQYRQQEAMAQENEAAKRLGVDLSGIQDPKMRQEALAYALQGANQQNLEQTRQQGKTNLFKEKQGFLGQLLGGQQGQQNSMTALDAQGSANNQMEQQEGGQFDPSQITDAQILQLSAMDPVLGREARMAKDAAARERLARDKMQNTRNLEQKKEVSQSYGENSKFIDKTYDQYEDSLRKQAILDRTDQLDEEGELSDSGMINFLESLGIKPEWLKNPANEEYSKLTLDLLGGGSLQADYGSRVLQSEFKVSLMRIPTLSQTKEGRKQIKENIRAMLLPSKLKMERMQYYLDKSERTGEPLPHNLRGKILQDIKPKLEEAYDQFKQRNGRYKVREGTSPDENAQEKYFYLAGENVEKALKMMREDGYDIED